MAKPSFSTSISGNFLDCVINKQRPLGIGSYGAVYEATYEELPCAAKVLHSSLFELDRPSHQKLLERFERECELLSKIRHPCIVQFLGVARDPGNRLPVLVMELMEESLTKFLERSDTELPIYLQINFSHDVALALTYLHSLDITHRDLSSNNVLLVAGTRAKVTDFGTSVFKSRGIPMLTSCPGTQAYMAPECFGEEVQYSQSIDCFSFGVLVVQIITRKFPNPSSRLDKAPPPRSRFNFGTYNPSERYMRVIPEVDRRRNHISLVDRKNPLRTIYMDCLNDTESARPSARDFCRDLAAIKEGSPLYKESIENASDYQFSVIQQCDATRDELQSTTSELQKTRSEIGDYRRENERLLLKNQSLEKQISELGQRVEEVEIQLIDSEQKQRGTQARGGLKGFLFGDKDKESLDKILQIKNGELIEVRTRNLSLQRKVETLQTILEQNCQDMASRDREIREKSDRIKNLRDKMDALEVEFSLERVRTSASFEEKVKELEEAIQELQESKDQIDELETQVCELEEQIEYLQKSLEKVYFEEISQGDEKIKEQSREIEDLKKSNKLNQESLDVCREEISLRDEKLKEQSSEIESLKRQLKKMTKPPRRSDTKSSRPKQSPLIRRGKHKTEDIIHHRQLDMDSLRSDSEDTVRSLEDDSEPEKQPAAVMKADRHPKKERQSVSPVSSHYSNLESYAANSDVLFSSAREHSPSLRSSMNSGSHCSDEEEISEEESDDLYCPPTPKETVDGSDAASSELSASSDVLQDQENSPCDDSTQPSSPPTVPSCQIYGQSAISSPRVFLLLAAAIKMHPSSLTTSIDSQPQLKECADEYSDEPSSQLESDPIDEQLCEHFDQSLPSSKTISAEEQHPDDSPPSMKTLSGNSEVLPPVKSTLIKEHSDQHSNESQFSVKENTDVLVRMKSNGRYAESQNESEMTIPPHHETSSSIPKTSVQNQESQTATSQLQDLNGTAAPNPSQNVVTPQTQPYSAVPSGATASPSYEGTTQASNALMTPPEILSPPVSAHNQPICRYSDTGTQTVPDSGTPPQQNDRNIVEHTTAQILCNEQQSSANYVLSVQASAVQTGQLQSGLLGQPYPQTTNINGQQQSQYQQQPLPQQFQTHQSPVLPPQLQPSQTQPSELFPQKQVLQTPLQQQTTSNTLQYTSPHVVRVHGFSGSGPPLTTYNNQPQLQELPHGNEPIPSQSTVTPHNQSQPTLSTMAPGSVGIAQVQTTPQMFSPSTVQSHSTAGHTQQYPLQTQTAAQSSVQQGAHESLAQQHRHSEQSLSANYGMSSTYPQPQASTLPPEHLGGGRSYPQNTSEQQQRENQAQLHSPPLQQAQVQQGHVWQLQAQPSHVAVGPPQLQTQNSPIQRPQPHTQGHSIRQQTSLEHVNNVSGSGFPATEVSKFQATTQNQLSHVAQSHASHMQMLPPETACNPPNNTVTSQTQLHGHQMLPTLNQSYVQQNGALTQQVHLQSPEQASTAQAQDSIVSQTIVQATSRQQHEQPQVQPPQQIHSPSPTYTMHSGQTQPIAASSTRPYESSQPSSHTTVHSTWAQAPKQLFHQPSQVQASLPRPDYSSQNSPDNFGQGQVPMQHPASLSTRRPSELCCISLSTLHENVEETATQSQQQETSYSSHNQHPTQPSQQLPLVTRHDKLQVNLKNQNCAQQQSLDTKQSASNQLTNELASQRGHYNQTLTTDLQQTNVLDKAQVGPIQDTKVSFQGGERPIATDQYSKTTGSTPQQQIYPDNQRANVPSTAASNNITSSQPEHVNIPQGMGSGTSRQIPLPQTHKTPGPGNAHMHTAPVDIPKQYNIDSIPQHPPSSHPSHQSAYNQSNMQALIPNAIIGASAFSGGQSTANMNVRPGAGHYGVMATHQQYKANTAPHYHISSQANSGAYQGLPREVRGANSQYEQYQQDPGLIMNVPPEQQHQTPDHGAGQSHAVYSPEHPHPHPHHPPTQSTGHLQGQYHHQSSVSSEESSISSLGNHPSPQSSYDSQPSSTSSKHHQSRQHSVHHQNEMARRSLSSPNPNTHSPGQEFPFLEVERERAQCSNLGSYPLPDQSLYQHMQFQHTRHPPDRRQFQRSDSAVSYPRNRSEPSFHPGGGRRPYPPCRRRPYQTAPQFIILPQPYDPYYRYSDEYDNHHLRYTIQHYPMHKDPYDIDGYDDRGDYYDNGQEFGYRQETSGHDPRPPYHRPYHEGNPEVWSRQQTSGHDPRAPYHRPYHEGNPEFWSRQQTSGHDPRPPDHRPHRERNLSESSNPQTRRQTSSSDESSISIDSPRGIRSSGPADTYPFVSQQRDERLIQVLGKSAQAEEYSVVLMQPEYVDDMNSPWTAIFAMCRRNPNCINALLDKIQGPSGSQYSVAHISILFDSENKVILDIPKKEAEKQGYMITTSVVPCLIRRSEATPSQEGLGPHADAIYPPRHTLTIHPSTDVLQRRQLNIQLKLSGAKDCVRHFVLKNPIYSPSRQNATRPITHTQPQSPPMEQTGILQSEPNVTVFLNLVGDRIPHMWRGLGSFLGVPQYEIDKIAHIKEQTDVTRCPCLVAVFEHWKNHLDKSPTWSDLIMAVKNVDETLALTMQHQLISGQIST